MARLREMRAQLVALLLIVAGSSGCILSPGQVSTDETDEDTRNCTRENANKERDFSLVTGQTETFENSIGHGPATGELEHGGEGIGTYSLTVAHEGEEFFDRAFTRAGPHGPTAHSFDELEAGNYTVTVSIEEGRQDLNLAFRLSFTQGCSN